MLYLACFVAGCLYFSVGFILGYLVDTQRNDVEPDVFLWVAFPFVMLAWPPVVVYLAMKRKTAERRQLRALDFAHKFEGGGLQRMVDDSIYRLHGGKSDS